MKNNMRALSVLFLTVLLSLGADESKNPVSKLFVTDLAGDIEINNGERSETLTEQSVYDAQGILIETQPQSAGSMVFSNSVGMSLDQSTRVEIRKFKQEPFLPNRADVETEPSISQKEIFVIRGAIGVCPPKMVPGSSLKYSTGLGSINVRSGRLVIESDDCETRFSLVSGDATVITNEFDLAGTTIHPDQQIIIRNLPGKKTEVVVQNIPDENRKRIEDLSSMACVARRTVYFDTAPPEIDGPLSNGEDQLIPISVISVGSDTLPLSTSRINSN